MGRIRGREDNEYWQGVNREVFELFSNYDFVLWVLCPNNAVKQDPLYGEITPKDMSWKSFKVSGFIQEYIRDSLAIELGIDIARSTTAWLNRRELENAGVLPHGTILGLASPGDVLAVYEESSGDLNGGFSYYDIDNVDRKGYLNDSDKWTYLELQLKRRDSFTPERKIESPC